MGGMDLRTGRSMSERLNVPLEDVLYMPIGKEFIFRRGQKPIVTTRYDIMKDEKYQQITKEYEGRIAGCDHLKRIRRPRYRNVLLPA